MTTKNSAVEIQNLIVNHKSRPVKSNPVLVLLLGVCLPVCSFYSRGVYLKGNETTAIIENLLPLFLKSKLEIYALWILIAVCFGATYRTNLLIPFFTSKHTFFTSNNVIFNTITHAHFFYTF